MEMTGRAAVLGFASAVTACGVPPGRAGELHGFMSDKANNLFGYYNATSEVRFGKFALDNFAIAEPADLRKFEAGGYRGVPFAPVMFELDDTTSAKKQSETGEYYVNAPRVLPSAYRVVGNSVTFIGTDKQLGVVVFAGTIDLAKLRTAQSRGGTDAPVLRGDLTVGTKTLKNVAFTWFGGD